MSFGYNYNFSYYPISGQYQQLGNDVEANDFVINVYPVWYSQVTLDWSVPAAWGATSFNVYKSEDGDGPFTILNQTPITTNYFKDPTTQAVSKFNSDTYVVEAVLSTGQRIKSGTTTWTNKQSRWVELRANDIQRREWILLRKFTGVKSVVFRKKTYGKRCSVCWNTDTKKVMDDHCLTCYGTSFEGGYFLGIPTYIQYEATPNNKVFTSAGITEPSNLGAWTISVPELNSLDIVLRVPDWKVYRVDNIMPTELQTVTVRQVLQLIELDKESIEFKLATSDANIFPPAYNI